MTVLIDRMCSGPFAGAIDQVVCGITLGEGLGAGSMDRWRSVDVPGRGSSGGLAWATGRVVPNREAGGGGRGGRRGAREYLPGLGGAAVVLLAEDYACPRTGRGHFLGCQCGLMGG